MPKVLNSCAKEALRQFVKFGETRLNATTTNTNSISRSYSVQGEVSHQARNYYDGQQ